MSAIMLWRMPLALYFLAACSSGASSASPADAVQQEFDSVVSLSGDRRIALHCAGQGHFTVLLETGDGGHRAHMAKLFAALAERYRVCGYDRQNVGQSSSAPIPRRAAELTADAFDALSMAQEHGPYILFGTSMGGLLVRAFAATHNIAGFVTSNQPCTSREWTTLAHAVMSPSERAADEAWMAGENNEHIDTNDLSRIIDGAPPAQVPHIILVSTERFQCPAAGTCGPTYRAFVAASRQAASAGRNGKFRLIDGNHDLYVTNLGDVVAAIDEVAFAAFTMTSWRRE
jgi:pimeloyl-ACP methyl ester carboxylesterase